MRIEAGGCAILRGVDLQHLIGTQQHRPHAWHEVAGLLARLVNGRRILVAHTVVQRKVGLYLKRVLPVKIERHAPPVAKAGTGEERGSVNQPAGEIAEVLEIEGAARRSVQEASRLLASRVEPEAERVPAGTKGRYPRQVVEQFVRVRRAPL